MDDKIVKEAKKRFKICEELDADNRRLFVEDLKFANGDADNGYQWPDAQYKERTEAGKPCVTINKVKQHNRQITNDARQNKPSVKVLPVDDNADPETAEVLNGIIRHIESQSSADVAYDTAAEFAVDGGIGYWRITTDYVDDDTNDQEIYIKRVKNPLNVYLGPHNEADGSDAPYGFIFDDMQLEDYETYGYGKPSQRAAFEDEWRTEDTIRVAEYFRIVEKEVQGKVRKRKQRAVEWYLINNEKVLEKREWLGKYVPIVRVVGSEVDIDGKTVRTGHTRQLKDPQRIYNYWSSSAVEFVALQGKQPYIAPAEAMSGYEDKWGAINTSNDPVIPYNHKDDSGEQIPMPKRQEPPVMAQAYITGMQISSDEMKAASGQYDAQFGENANAQSGRALASLQRKGDNATFHFIDNVARAIKFTGMILVDLIPKIYDTRRVVRMLGEDGKESKAMIDPEQPKAVQKEVNHEKGEIEKIYNPSVGRYDVSVSVGASYGTRRQEAFYALTEMVSRTPQLMQIAGDLVMKAADFPYAEELAERLEKTIPPELMKPKGDDEDAKPPSPELQQKDAMIKQLDELVQKLHGELNNKANEDQKQMALEQKKLDNQREIELMKARMEQQTKRDLLSIERTTPEDMEMDRQLVEQLASSIMQGMQTLAEAQQQLSQQQSDSMAQLAQQLTRPKQVVRDQSGRIVGVQ